MEEPIEPCLQIDRILSFVCCLDPSTIPNELSLMLDL